MAQRAILIALVVALILAGIAWAAGTLTIDRWVIGSGGGRSEAGGYTLISVLGQPVAGVVSNGETELCAGFGCDAAPTYYVYLPLIRKDSP